MATGEDEVRRRSREAERKKSIGCLDSHDDEQRAEHDRRTGEEDEREKGRRHPPVHDPGLWDGGGEGGGGGF